MLCLREIGSRPNSCINMILRQVSFGTLTAYFLARQMSDVSADVTGREWLTVVFFFSPQCYEDQRGFYVDQIAMEGEDTLSDGERFFRGEGILERCQEKMRMGLGMRGASQVGSKP